jgi:hypothetical protein
MKSTTSMVATQYRMQDWVEQIKACQDRPVGMKIIDWCSINGITKGTYYYRLRKVREACLESLPEEMLPRSVVPVPREIMDPKPIPNAQTGLDISANGFSVHVTENTSLNLLAAILQVMAHA